MRRSTGLWLLWTVSTLAGAFVLVTGLLYGGTVRSTMLIGRTTDGHHQIELACTACHQTPFGGKAEIQRACVGCHAKDLAESKDTHPAKKFTDPRNADRLEKLEATLCITCHTEHKPQITQAMGVTLPTDYCALCHQDIGKDRPSHEGLSFASCANSGCHNYHDNRALYEDFLEKHLDDPGMLSTQLVKLRTEDVKSGRAGKPIVNVAAADAPSGSNTDPEIMQDWLATAHAKAGINCSGCHVAGAKTAAEMQARWVEKPDHKACATCHMSEVKTFTEGKHGMRLADGLMTSTSGLWGVFSDTKLGPMHTSLARLKMSPEAGDKSLVCTTCHAAHKFETKTAEVQACLGCHADEHSRNYLDSPHHKLWKAELSGQGKKGSGVTCATCHMPRATHEDPDSGEYLTAANHNQNANLRPNEKMIRSVCMSCHGLGFSIDALADLNLITRNFIGSPSARVKSIDWVIRRIKQHEGRAGEPAGAK